MTIFSPKALEKIIENCNMDQVKFAQYVGISAEKLANYLDGSEIPILEDLVKIANYTGESIDAIVGRRCGTKATSDYVEEINQKRNALNQYKSEIEEILERISTIQAEASDLLKAISSEQDNTIQSAYDELMTTPVWKLGLKSLTRNRLLKAKITTLGELIAYVKRGDLCYIRGLGNTSRKTILEKIYEITGEDYRHTYLAVFKYNLE